MNIPLNPQKQAAHARTELFGDDANQGLVTNPPAITPTDFRRGPESDFRG
jgi:hypothetical protein